MLNRPQRNLRRLAVLLQAGTALPLFALAVPANADPIVEHSDTDITVDATEATGTPIAVELSSTDGSIDATVTTVSGTAQAGDREAIVGLETGANAQATGAVDSIVGNFDSITGTGEGELLGLGASSYNGDVTLNVGTLDVDGAATAGIYATSVNGDVAVTADSVITRGTGEDSQNEYYEAVFAQSENGSVTLDVGSSETFGVYASALVGLAGDTVSITGDTATSHYEQTVTVYARGVNGASVDVGTIVQTSENGGQGAYLEASAGDASLTADTITVGDYSQAARINASGNVTADIGSMTGGSGLYVDTTAGDVAVTVGSAQTYSTTINASTVSGGNISIDGGTLSSNLDSASTIVASAMGGGAIDMTLDSVSGTGVDHATVDATTDSGDIAIVAGEVSASGDGGMGILAQSTDGDIDLAVDTVATTGLDFVQNYTADGVVAITQNGTASVTVGSGTTEGYATSVAAAVGGAGAHVTIDEASAAGQYGAVVYASSSGGDASVDAGSITLRGDQQAGVNVLSQAGMATVNVGSVVSEGTLGQAIFARGVGASVTSGTADVNRNAISAQGLNGSAVSISTTGDTTADTGFAIYGTGGDVTITTGADTLTQGETYGILALSSGSATITNNGTVAATGDTGSAIYATAPGAISIISDAVEVTGAGADPGADQNGMRIPQGGVIVNGTDGPITMNLNTVNVEGQYRYGVHVATNGTVDLVANEVSNSSDDSLAVAVRGGAGDVSVVTGTVTTTGVSGGGVAALTDSGNISIVSDVTRVEAGGIQGNYTGDAVTGISQSGNVSITSNEAFSAGYGGSAVVGIGANVALDTAMAETSGDAGIAVYAAATGPGGTATVDSGTIVTAGENTRALYVYSNGGDAIANVGDITTNTEVNTAYGILARGFNSDVTIDGDVLTGGMAVNSQSFGGESNVTVNGSVMSAMDIGVSTFAQFGTVTVNEGASIDAERAAVVFTNLSNTDPGVMHVENHGSITGSAAIYVNPNQQGIVPDVYIHNDGTLTGTTSGFAVYTGSGGDVLELTENSIVDGMVDLGDGSDRLVLDFNDDAPADAIGNVASTVNVEYLAVDSGAWLAEGPTSFYDKIEIDDSARLIIAQNEGYVSVVAPTIELYGRLDLLLTTDTMPGDLTGLLVEGDGSVHLTGPATLLVDDASGLQYTGGTFVENGTLLLTDQYGGDITTSGDGVFQVGTGGTMGDFTGNLVNDGTFVFDRSDDYTFLGDFSGTGQFDKYGDGTIYFDGLYDFNGTTTVHAGVVGLSGTIAPDTVLDLSTGGTFDLSRVDGGTATIADLSGTGGNLILGTTVLTVNQAGDTAFAGSISGSGSLVKSGSGDLKLNGDSPSFTGQASVDGGTLSVNGDFSNATFVINAGGTLGGNGMIGETTIAGGTLAAGNSIDTLTIAGNLSLTSASILAVEVNAAGQADRVDVTGTASLGGATVNVLAASGVYAPTTTYTILTAAGGLNGTFGSVNSNLAFLDPTLGYSATDVTLTLTRNDVDYSTYAATANQAAVGNLIEALGYGSTLYDTTLVMDRGQVANSFATLTGEVYPAFGAALIESADLIRRETDGQMAAGSQGTFVWGAAVQGLVEGDGGTAYRDIKMNGAGVLAGVGFGSGAFSAAIGGGKVWYNPKDVQLQDAGLGLVVAQVGFNGPSGLSVKAGVQFGWGNGDVSRNTRLGTLSATVGSDVDVSLRQYYGELGFKVMTGGSFAIEPFAGIRRIELDYDDVTETGGATALTVTGLDRDVNFADLGLRLSSEATGRVAPYASANWRAAWGDRASLATIAFAGNAAGLGISALPIDKSALQAGAGIAYRGKRVTASLGYEGSYSKTFDSHGVKAEVSLAF